MASRPYWDPMDPEHETVKDQVAGVFAVEHAALDGSPEMHGRRPAAIVIDTSK